MYANIINFFRIYCFHIAATLGTFIAGFFYRGKLFLPINLLLILVSVALIVLRLIIIKHKFRFFLSHKNFLTRIILSLSFAVKFFSIGLLFFSLFKLGYKDYAARQKSIYVPRKCIFIGRVSDVPSFNGRKYLVKARIETIIDNHLDPTKRRANLDIKKEKLICHIITPFKLEKIAIGNRIKFFGNTLPTKFIKNDGYKNYLMQEKILVQVFIYSNEAITTLNDNKNAFKNIKSLHVDLIDGYHIFYRRVLLHAEEKVRTYIDYPAFGLAYALLTGERIFLARNIKNIFKDTGTYHTLAISGMHSVIILTICLVLLRAFSLNLKNSFTITLFVLFPFYLFLTGMRISILRAYSMMVIGYFMFFKLEYRVPPLIVLTLTFLTFVLINPNVIYRISFQLSFLAVFGIFIMLKFIHHYHIRNSVLQILSVSIGAEIFTVPLSGYYFGHINYLSLFYNLFVPLCISFSMTLSVILLLNPFSYFNVLIGNTLTLFNHVLFHVMDKLNQIFHLAYVEVDGLKSNNILFYFIATNIIIFLLIIFLSKRYFNREKKPLKILNKLQHVPNFKRK